jgi:hypothetical protein
LQGFSWIYQGGTCLILGMVLSTLPVSGQQALRIEAGTLSAAVQTQPGRLGPIVVREQSGHQITLTDAFALKLGSSRVIRSSEMKLERTPQTSVIPVDNAASRAAAHLAGHQLCADLSDPGSGTTVHWCMLARTGTSYLRQEINVRAGATALPVTQVQLLDFPDAAAHVVGTVAGSPIVSGNLFFGFEHPLSLSVVRDGHATAQLNRILPLAPGQAIGYSSVIGVARPGQMRRDFLNYVELERAHPYRTFLHYNTWYDLGEGNRFGAADVLNRMNAFGEELVRKRGVTMDSFLMDDGWDNTSSLWQFNKGFPDGFTPLRATAKQYGFGLGVWLSPWGGYEQEKQERIAYGKSQGYEIVKNGYALSGPRYYAKFEEACLNFVTKYGVNQFKIDGTGNADQVFPGSIFDSDFSAAIHLIERLRQRDNGIFINLTTGTRPSPFWLRYADSIWRSGEDHDFAGEGTWRQRWITYRDEQTYRNIVQGGPLFPLNSLMLHGIIYAVKAEHLATDPGHDFTAEVHSYFGTGTQLQEMYITPSLLSAADWDMLAESAKWSRTNAATLRDTHWIGGDPGRNQVYGWASWTAAEQGRAKGILTLRNPSSRQQSISIDVQQAFELPPDSPQHYRAHSPWQADRDKPAVELSAKQPHIFMLQPFEVLTLDAMPVH